MKQQSKVNYSKFLQCVGKRLSSKSLCESEVVEECERMFVSCEVSMVH